MTRPAACEYGLSGHCANGAHGSCAHRTGGPMEHGSWAPECYITLPPRRGHAGIRPIPDGMDRALVLTGPGVSVIRPSHVWRCPCECHTAKTAENTPDFIPGWQLELFEVA